MGGSKLVFQMGASNVMKPPPFKRSLSRRVLHAGIWAFALQAIDHLFIFGRTMVLAVLLSPKDFGLFGIAMLTLAAFDTLSRTGFHQALIQRRGDIEPYLETAWTIQCLRGLALALLLVLTAPLVAGFFGEPIVVPLLRVVSLSILLQAFTNIGVIAFQKDLEFNKEFIYRFSGTFSDLTVAVLLAYVFRNAWALVFGFLARNFVQLMVSYLIHPYRPRFRFEREKSTSLFSYGTWVMLGGVTVFIGSQGASIAIGKLLGVTALGLYQMARRIPQIVVNETSLTIASVAFPAYAQLQEYPEKFRDAYRSIASASVMLTMPFAVGIACLGSDFTRIFLGQKWLPMIPVLTMLSFASILVAIATTGRPIFLGAGKPRCLFQMQAVRALILGVFICPLSVFWGLSGAAAAVVLSSTGMLAIWCVQIRNQLSFGLKDMGKVMVPPILASTVMAGVIYGYKCMTFNALSGITALSISWFFSAILMGGATYLSCLYACDRVFPKCRLLDDILKVAST